MALSIDSTPNQNISGYDSEVASTEQLLYEFKREDYQVDRTVASANVIILDSSYGDVTSDFSIGEKIYCADKLDENPSGIFTIQALTFPSTETVIDVTEDFTISKGNTYINKTSDKYRLEVVIPEANDATFYFLPKSDGSIDFDLGPAISLLIPDGQSWLNYKLTYRGVWDGGADTPANSDFTLAIFSRRQILSEYGSNLYNFIYTGTTEGKFLTLFEEPKLWLGWTKTAEFINTNLTAVSIREVARNINKVYISENIDGYTGVDTDSIFSHDINEEPGAGFIEIIAQNSGMSIIYASSLYYRIEEPCRNPVMIEWLNSNGGWDSWLFQYQQTFTNVTEEGLKFESPIVGNIETNTGNKGRVAFKDTQLITLKADQLTQNHLQGLHDIKRSDEVKLWLNLTGTSFVKVRVNAGYETGFTSGKSAYEFSLNIELPDNFDFFKAKEY